MSLIQEQRPLHCLLLSCCSWCLRSHYITMAVIRSTAAIVIDAWWVLVLGVSDGDACPSWGRMLLPLPQAHTCWDCWCLWRDGELPWEKQSNGSLQHPSLWHHLRKRVIDTPELQEICFWHGFLAILLPSHPGCWQPKRQGFWGDAKG